MTLAGNGARLGLITPIAISKPEVQCARVCATVIFPPQPLTVMMELHNALLCIFRQTGVKEVFNGSRFCNVTVVGHSNPFLSRGNRLQKD